MFFKSFNSLYANIVVAKAFDDIHAYVENNLEFTYTSTYICHKQVRAINPPDAKRCPCLQAMKSSASKLILSHSV